MLRGWEGFTQSCNRNSLLEQVFEGCSCVGGANSAGSGFTFDGLANFVHVAKIGGVLREDSRGNRLATFEAGAGIEVNTHLARVQGESTFGTLGVDFGHRSHKRAALGATGDGTSTGHVQRAGTEGHILWLGFRGAALALAFSRILISVLAVFSIRHDGLRENERGRTGKCTLPGTFMGANLHITKDCRVELCFSAG